MKQRMLVRHEGFVVENVQDLWLQRDCECETGTDTCQSLSFEARMPRSVFILKMWDLRRLWHQRLCWTSFAWPRAPVQSATNVAIPCSGTCRKALASEKRSKIEAEQAKYSRIVSNSACAQIKTIKQAVKSEMQDGAVDLFPKEFPALSGRRS